MTIEMSDSVMTVADQPRSLQKSPSLGQVLAPKYTLVEPHDGATKSRLAADAEWAASVIERLLRDPGDDAMRPGIVNAAEGLAFVRCSKGALGLTMARGSGFVIRKLDQDRYGHSRWSAPVYFDVSQLGLGLSAGFETVESCLALLSADSIAHFTQPHTLVGTDLGLVTTEGGITGVPAGTYGNSTQMHVTADNQRACFTYSLASGVLVNVAINGTQTYPDVQFNNKLYGKGTALLDVLGGATGTFAEMMPLYRKISQTGEQALR